VTASRMEPPVVVARVPPLAEAQLIVGLLKSKGVAAAPPATTPAGLTHNFS
jgi:hypothetical protein